MPDHKVAVAISGGVDSAVAAALLKSRGYHVEGITMHLFSEASDSSIDTARHITSSLKIPHHTVDVSNTFKQSVIDPFCSQYSKGKTPNPCIACNNRIKFSVLLEFSRSIGASFLATGHYARIESSTKGLRLLKGKDNFKDQSYFLYTLNQQVLTQIMFPVGHLSKIEVKRLKYDYQLPLETNHESQDICFLGSTDYRSFLKQRLEGRQGKIIDSQGQCLGFHEGIFNYTIGQRHGLNLDNHNKLYVTGINAEDNSIIVGPEIDLFKSQLRAEEVSWISGTAPSSDTPVTARIRYRAPEVPVQIRPCNSHILVNFFSPVKSISPGQSIVFYCGDEVLGGGIIQG